MEELALLEQADKQLNELVDTFAIEIDTIFASGELNDELSRLYDILEYPKTSGSIDVERSARNLVIINKFRGKFQQLLKTSSYGEAVNIALRSLNAIIELYDDYFDAIVANYGKSAYRELYKQSLLLARETLLGAGMNSMLVNPIIDKIYQHNLQGIRRKELEKLMNDYFESNNLPKRYIKQQANDTLMQMTQHYQHTVSEGLGLKHYLYAGTLITTSRSFCNTRVGKVFTKAEIESWASLNWDGKVVGTTKENIFVYRGGWNCRHTFRPISEKLYEKLNK